MKREEREEVRFNLGLRRCWVTERNPDPVAFSSDRKWICFLLILLSFRGGCTCRVLQKVCTCIKKWTG